MTDRLYIRVDGNAMIGLGHLMRCIALGQMLKGSFDITFFCKTIPDKLMEVLSKNKFGLEKISDEIRFLDKLKSDDIVVLDGYDFDTNYQKKIKKSGCKLVCIDDLHDKEFIADLIINHAPGVKAEDYRAQEYTRFAIGPEYALLRPAFLWQAQEMRVIKKAETVFICFGGTDNRNLTEEILSSVLTFLEFRKIIVVTGTEFSNLDSLKRIVARDERVSHHHAVNEQELLALMRISDLAIVPSSVILFEALAAGCKVISGYYVDNQREIYLGFLALNCFIDAKNFASAHLINSLRKVNEHSTIRIFDGKSSGRLLNIIKKLNDASPNIS